jgi:hypothetical protein
MDEEMDDGEEEEEEEEEKILCFMAFVNMSRRLRLL